ncbi:uncharacterized protein LOC121379727 [Gigantopelta aegis]|uniref:uncharacterized protein LOC121379727 n=1 Tax=Gigantopelta aegis TaxID=1735272 RepID=UPI001B88D310|nr:uncharacterized protein LOC121379727 [Gigantopelta aegis]
MTSQAGNCMGLGRAFPSKDYCNEHFQDRPRHDVQKSDDKADLPSDSEDEGFYGEAERIVAKAKIGKDCNEHFQDRPRHDVQKSDDEADSMFDTEDEDYSDGEPWADFTDWSDSEGLKCKEHFNDPPGSVVCCREEYRAGPVYVNDSQSAVCFKTSVTDSRIEIDNRKLLNLYVSFPITISARLND